MLFLHFGSNNPLRKTWHTGHLLFPFTLFFLFFLADFGVAQDDMSLPEKKTSPDPLTPTIFITEKQPALLVLIEGEPAWRKISSTGLYYSLNTPWILLQDPEKKTYFLLANNQWLSTNDLEKGPWKPAQAPSSLQQLPLDSPLATSLTKAKIELKAPAPEIFVSKQPAILVSFKGPPTWESIPSTNLERATNTSLPVLRNPKDHTQYLLFSGRWFQNTPNKTIWTLLPSQDLPSDLAQLPSDTDWARPLRMSIPGTQEAEEALFLAQSPHITQVTQGPAYLNIQYQEDLPLFVPIPNTSLKQAINTVDQVLKSPENHYYCARNSVWFQAPTPNGPWQIATQLPPSIKQIPPTHPYYNLTYLTIQEQSHPTTVTFHATAGYFGTQIQQGLVVYQSGSWQGPWLGTDWYTPYPSSYGPGLPTFYPSLGRYKIQPSPSLPIYNTLPLGY